MPKPIRTQAGNTVSSATSQVNYSLEANGAMTSDGLRTFEYDESRRLSKVKLMKDGEAAAVQYLHNALGQRVFKSEPQAEQTLPSEDDLGPGFINWIRKSFGWLFAPGNSPKASLGMAFVYDEQANLLGEYDNGSALGRGKTEYIWLPTESGQAIPIGLYKNGKFYAVHSDHLGAPRLVTDPDRKPVWQWPYSAFGNNKTTGPLLATTANGQTTLKGTKALVDVNLRFPGQYFDDESNLSYNYFRSYNGSQGRYTQADPIGLAGGVNRFTYVENSPLRFADPLGLFMSIEMPSPDNPIPATLRDPLRSDGKPWGCGCGNSGNDALVPDFFPSACASHDQCYENQLGQTVCDTQFRVKMFQESPYSPELLRLLYYLSVKMGGSSSYRDARGKLTCPLPAVPV